MLERPRDKSGERYEYFTCSVRRRKTTQCTRSAILAERAEAEIERTYQRNSLTQTQAEHVRKVLNDVFDQLEGSSEDERKVLTAQRDKLEAERLELVQAHYADAIPLDLLKSEQDRIRVSLDQITSRLDNLTDTYAEARTGLDQLTELLVDLDDLYNKCDPAERRILNRALSTRITIDDEENATYTPEQTTASILAHTSIDAPAHVTAETKLPRHQAGQVSIFSSYVELRGFEPLTFSLRTRRATNCAIAPCLHGHREILHLLDSTSNCCQAVFACPSTPRTSFGAWATSGDSGASAVTGAVVGEAGALRSMVRTVRGASGRLT